MARCPHKWKRIGIDTEPGRVLAHFECQLCQKKKTLKRRVKIYTKLRKLSIRRAPLRPISKKESARMAKYRELCRNDAPIQRCERCRMSFLIGENGAHRHHPYGRSKGWLYQYIFLCSQCHEWVHFGQPNVAYEQGWLQPPYRGRPDDPLHPRPWKSSVN